jgi:Predicted glycosyltransferases
MPELITVAIPTRNRPQLLVEALRSCFDQTYRPLEIIIGDDSTNDLSERAIARLEVPSGIDIRYVRNEKSLGQAGNVNNLFQLAKGHKLAILHDDDLLLPDAIAELDACWQVDTGITAAFGKQYLIREDGTVLSAESEHLNISYYRTPDYEGTSLSSIEAALVQQFPNDGYLLLTEAAQRVLYRSESEFGTNRWCDFDFGIRLAQQYEKFYFLNKYTAKYRLTSESVSKHGYPTYMYPLIEELEVSPDTIWAKDVALKRLAPIVIYNYARLGAWKTALRIFCSRYYPLRKRASPSGMKRLASIVYYGLRS